MDIQAIKAALENLIEVEIVTAVGAVKKNDKGKLDFDPDKTQVCFTRIDLLRGDITQSVDPALLGDDRKAVRDLHEANSKQGMQIVRDNIAAVRELAQLIRELG